jgi:hypothetical protein
MMFSRLKGMLGSKAAEVAPGPAASGEEVVLANAYCTVGTLPGIDFPHTLNSRRDIADPELKAHLEGFLGYVQSRGDGQMTRVRYHACRHIQRVNQHVSLSFDAGAFDAFADWAARANAIVFLPDGSLRDPQGRILLDAGGRSDPQAHVPYPRQAWERKARSDALIKASGIRVPESLPPLVSEPELRMRAPGDVAARALALQVVAVRAQSFVEGPYPVPIEEFRRNSPAAFDYLSPKERRFLEQQDPPRDLLPQFTWRHEALFLLEWALGLIDTLPFPSAVCDAALAVRVLVEGGAERLIDEGRLRPADEILDALDLHYRLHWAVRQARLDKHEAPGLDGGVILERHYALNWLVRFEESDWDAVDTPT